MGEGEGGEGTEVTQLFVYLHGSDRSVEKCLFVPTLHSFLFRSINFQTSQNHLQCVSENLPSFNGASRVCLFLIRYPDDPLLFQ